MVTPSEEQPGQTPDGAGEPIDQSSIDALSAGANEGDGAGSASPSEGVSQADIDALLNAAGDGEVGSVPGGSAGRPEPKAEPDTPLDTLGRPFDDAAVARQAVLEDESAAKAAESPTSALDPVPVPGSPVVPAAPPPETSPYSLPELSIPAGLGIDPKRVTMLNDVKLRVKIELGRTRMLVEDVLGLGEGSVVELDKLAGDPVDVYVNERLVARGEVLILNDNFCVRINEVLSGDPHRVSA